MTHNSLFGKVDHPIVYSRTMSELNFEYLQFQFYMVALIGYIDQTSFTYKMGYIDQTNQK